MKVFYVIISMFVLLFLTTHCTARIVRGVVKTISGIPVKNAVINFVSSDTPLKSTVAFTDEYGRYIAQIADKNERESNSSYLINQNYPNPFSQQTIIEYYVRENASVRVFIFDILGRIVKSFKNVYSSPGIQWLTWNGTDDFGRRVSDGVYFLSMEGEHGPIIKKIVYVKNLIGVSELNIARRQIPILEESKKITDNDDYYNIYLSNVDSTEPKILPENMPKVLINTERPLDFKVHRVIKEFLGLEGKLLYRILYVKPYIYVSAARDGLWRYNVDKRQSWEFLGLADTGLTNDIRHGVIDFDVFGKEILAAYNGSNKGSIQDSNVAIWHSTDAGKYWFRSDSGIPETRKYQSETNMISALRRSPLEPNVILAKYGALYRSTDNGYNWQLIQGQRGTIVNQEYLTWNPLNKGEIWFYGQSSTFEGYLYCLTENGSASKLTVDLSGGLGLDPSVCIYDVSFDFQNANVILVSTSSLKGGILSSKDGGLSWKYNSYMIPNDMAITKIISYPAKPLIRYMINRNYVYISREENSSVAMIEYFNNEQYLHDAALDVVQDRLFLSTDKGVYVIMVEK